MGRLLSVFSTKGKNKSDMAASAMAHHKAMATKAATAEAFRVEAAKEHLQHSCQHPTGGVQKADELGRAPLPMRATSSMQLSQVTLSPTSSGSSRSASGNLSVRSISTEPELGASASSQVASQAACSRAAASATCASSHPASPMRRNESAAAQLQDFALSEARELKQRDSKCESKSLKRQAQTDTFVRRNKSSGMLSEMGRRERQTAASLASRHAVVEAVALQLQSYMGDAGSADADVPAHKQLLPSMQTYIITIVKQLDLPNSCIVAMLIYLERAVGHERFQLTPHNWQPCVLAAFVVAAKLCFDEPVWNEDFVKALRISNIPVSQISRWEASFLQLIDYNTNVDLQQYAALCFKIQQRYERMRGEHIKFFTYLMLQAKYLDERESGEGEPGSAPKP